MRNQRLQHNLSQLFALIPIAVNFPRASHTLNKPIGVMTHTDYSQTTERKLAESSLHLLQARQLKMPLKSLFSHNYGTKDPSLWVLQACLYMYAAHVGFEIQEGHQAENSRSWQERDTVWQKAHSAHLHSSACLPLLKIFRSATAVIPAYKAPI